MIVLILSTKISIVALPTVIISNIFYSPSFLYYNIKMEKDTNELNLNAYAHIGDAVYEVFIREKIIHTFKKISEIHKRSTSLVCAAFQEKMLFFLEPHLTDEEKDLTRRARNIHLTKGKRNNQTTHRQATAFETLIGYNYLNDRNRLEYIYKLIEQNPDFLGHFE